MSDRPGGAAGSTLSLLTPSPSPPGDSSLAPGSRLGPFEIIDRLGAGGMGEVYRGRDTRLGRTVALKVLPAQFLSDREGLARFALEARSASALNHPNIVTIFEVGAVDSSPYLAMELIEGWTLRHLIEAGPLPVRRTLDLAAQIADGLAKAHQAGIVHRDLKPENIMVSQDGFVKILDFGLAKHSGPGSSLGVDPSLTSAGFILGTPDYMSPEQAAGRPLTFRSDQFAAGVVFYEMLTRRKPFHRDTPVQTLSAIIQEDPESLETANARVPPPLRWLIERCLAKDPDDRYSATRELARDLKQIRDNLSDFPQSAERRTTPRWTAAPAEATPASAAPETAPTTRTPPPAMRREAAPEPRPSSPRPPSPRRKGRRIGELAVLLLLGLSLFSGGAYVGHWFRSQHAEPPPPIWKAAMLVGPMTRAMAPRISPDGQTLAFVTLTGGRSSVAVMRPSSGDWTVVTRRADSGSVHKVCWSRDGNRIFFDRVHDVPRGIYSVSPLGGEERLVVEDAQGPETLPDGSLLIVKRDAARNFQIHRLWPDTGKTAAVGPPVVAEAATWSLRAFPDGKRAIFWGKLAGRNDTARRVYALDIATGRATPFAPQLPLAPPLAIGPGGSSVIAFVTFGDLQQAISVSAAGDQGRILFPVTGKAWSVDAGGDGSLYVSTMDNTAELIRFPATGGVPDQLATMAGNLLTGPVQFSDGGVLIPNQVLGRRRLVISGPDGQLRPFLDAAEQATPPAAVVGENLVAFLSGSVGRPATLAIATLPEGRIVRRLEASKGVAPQSLAASPDGKTLYYVAAGSLYSIGIDGGSPRKMRAANGVAVDPREPSPSLIVQVNELDGVKLYRVPLSGGWELPLLFASPLKLAPTPISGAAVGPDGRIAVTVTSPESSFRGLAILDPMAGTLERVPVAFDGDLQYPAWQRDGKLLAMGVSIRSSLWRFQAQTSSGRLEETAP